MRAVEANSSNNCARTSPETGTDRGKEKLQARLCSNSNLGHGSPIVSAMKAGLTSHLYDRK